MLDLVKDDSDRPISAAMFKFGLVPADSAAGTLEPASLNFLLVCASAFRGGGAVSPFEMQCGRDRTMFSDGEFTSTYGQTGVAVVSTSASGPNQNETKIWLNLEN